MSTLDGAPVPISLYTGQELPAFQPGLLNFDYVLAGNGLFLRARQGGLEIVVPVSTIRGLPPLAPSFRWDYPLVPAALVQAMLEQARQARDEWGNLLEILFYLTCDEEGWQLHIPEQDQAQGHVMAREGGREVFLRARIEVHSHGALRPYFSATDNRGEGLLRIYGVLGHALTTPAICVRGSAYGVYLPVPASLIFDLAGTGVVDAWFGALVGAAAQEGSSDGPLF